ncbi:restriction endonuclease subunit S [uncultured Alteromonas sp.]|uniref:restriction endonuclease subunit S n=1 Tax=uncultured Alteromonas sp. TaxID=179113 RepID=UPI0030DC1445
MKFDMSKEFNTPNHWASKKIGEIAKFNASSWTQKNAPALIHYIDIKSVSTGSMEEPKPIIFSEAPSRARRIVTNGSIIISTVRPNLKQLILLENCHEVNLTASTGFCVIDVENEDLKWFLYTLITSEKFTTYLERIAEGAAYPAYKPTDISESIITVPPPSELRMIANIARSINSKINNNTRMNQTLEKIAQRIFKSWFIDFDPVKANAKGEPFAALDENTQALFPSSFEENKDELVPKGWNLVPLADVAHISTAKTAIENITTENYISTDNMLAGRKGVTEATKLPNVSKVNAFMRDDILFSNIRTYFKKVWYSSFDGGASGDVLIWRPNTEEKISSEYLYQIVSGEDFIEYSVRTSKGVKMPRGDKEALLKYQIVCPSKDVMHAFTDLIRPLITRIGENQKQNIILQKIRERITPQLISGKTTL